VLGALVAGGEIENSRGGFVLVLVIIALRDGLRCLPWRLANTMQFQSNAPPAGVRAESDASGLAGRSRISNKTAQDAHQAIRLERAK